MKSYSIGLSGFEVYLLSDIFLVFSILFEFQMNLIECLEMFLMYLH